MKRRASPHSAHDLWFIWAQPSMYAPCLRPAPELAATVKSPRTLSGPAASLKSCSYGRRPKGMIT